MGKIKGAINFAEAEKDIKKTEAIINSMTAKDGRSLTLSTAAGGCAYRKGAGPRCRIQ